MEKEFYPPEDTTEVTAEDSVAGHYEVQYKEQPVLVFEHEKRAALDAADYGIDDDLMKEVIPAHYEVQGGGSPELVYVDDSTGGMAVTELMDEEEGEPNGFHPEDTGVG